MQKALFTLGSGNGFHKIILSTMTGHAFVSIPDIIYCEADENYTHFYLKGQLRYTASRPLKDYEELLEKHHFFRTHKSFLINLNHVEFLSKERFVVMSNQKEIPVSFRKHAEFNTLLKTIDIG